jgi:rare lipoprotein A
MNNLSRCMIMLLLGGLAAVSDDRPSPVRYGSSRRSAMQPARGNAPGARPLASKTTSEDRGNAKAIKPTEAAAYPEIAAQSETGTAGFYNNSDSVQASDGLAGTSRIHNAAHRSYPIGSLVRVTQLSSGKSTLVKITDRMHLVGDRIISVNRSAAEELSFVNLGITKVQVDLLPPMSVAKIIP